MEWVIADASEVPGGDGWLGAREREVLAALAGERRRGEWRLGRWAAKRLLGTDVEVLPADDGAPEAWRGDERLSVSVSIAHRRGRALAVVADGVAGVGCDLEPLREDRDVLPFVAWEAAAKALRRGLLGERPRVEILDAVFVVAWPDVSATGRWWIESDWAHAIASPGGPG